MGVVRTGESKRTKIEEFRRTVLSCSALQRRKDEEELRGLRFSTKGMMDHEDEKLVCVTSGVSFLGLAIVDCLLLQGYSVRIIVDNEEDMEKVKEMEMTFNNKVNAVMAKLSEVLRLTEAFEGCRGVFHTSAFADPAGISGYSKSMAEIEVKACENVMEACARTSSVRNCVLTSSLVACIWREGSLDDLSSVVNHDSWSDESVCKDKKLWYALGKLRAEKAAWGAAEGKGFKLATICPGLVTGPQFYSRNPTATIAYLKGAQEMYANGLLATVDVNRLAKAHVSVFQAMNNTAFGRYICFDNVIGRAGEAESLAQQIGMPANKICSSLSCDLPSRFILSKRKLSSLMSRTLRSCYNES